MAVSLGSIAHSLDTPAELGPRLAVIFAPFSSLGGQPRRIVGLLRAGGVGRGSRVLELACGKGPAAIAAARALGCRVEASDVYEPFIEEARRAARQGGVERLCSFRVANAAAWEARRCARYDAAMMISLWPAARAARILRRLVRPGGVYLFDDAVLTPGAPRRFRLAGIRTREEIRALIESTGDRVLREHLESESSTRRREARFLARLDRRCAGLAIHEPTLRPALRRLIEQQRRAIEDLCGPIRGAIWLARRGS